MDNGLHTRVVALADQRPNRTCKQREQPRTSLLVDRERDPTGVHLYQLTGRSPQAYPTQDESQPHIAHLVEGLAVVHANNRTDHLRHDDHIPQVRTHGVRLLAARRLALRLAQLLNERQRLALQPALEPARYPSPCQSLLKVRTAREEERLVPSPLRPTAQTVKQQVNLCLQNVVCRLLCAGSQQAIPQQQRTANTGLIPRTGSLPSIDNLPI